MLWSEKYGADKQPTNAEINQYIGGSFFHELCAYIEETYKISSKIEYSKCSMARGWNIKYKKESKSVCTIYPNQGFFTCMVVIGSKEASEAELILTACTSYTQELYRATNPFNGSRWLMIDVTSGEILNDVEELIGVRVKTKKSE